jgi:tetratricopeptide (TPR) repeat protein
VDVRDLDPAVRSALRGLDPRNAERVAGYLVAAGTLVDEDPEQALAHARAARDRASRVAAVREAVGVAAYHAGDFAEAAREIRAYRRMSGDQGYRAVLADCERALGRPEVALRLVTEALAESPDADERTELRLVEAGARRDLGELAAARLLLEGELGGRPDPSQLDPEDGRQVRIAGAYADLLEALGDDAAAEAWSAAVAAATPEDAVEFSELELEDEDQDEDVEPAATAPEVVERIPEDDEDLGKDFNAQVEAEVAELLGEIEPPASEDGSGSAQH